MRVSFAGLILCEVNFSAPKDKAEARVVGENAEPFEFEELAGDCAVTTFLDWRRSCKAFASAFSWVRTKLARFYRTIGEKRISQKEPEDQMPKKKAREKKKIETGDHRNWEVGADTP